MKEGGLYFCLRMIPPPPPMDSMRDFPATCHQMAVKGSINKYKQDSFWKELSYLLLKERETLHGFSKSKWSSRFWNAKFLFWDGSLAILLLLHVFPLSIEHFTDQIDHFTNLIDHFTNLTDHFTNLIDHFTNLIDHFTNLIDHFTNQIDHFTNLIDHFTGQIEHLKKEPLILI